MSSQTKRRLKIYLPILIVAILVSVFVLIFILNDKVTAKDYFNAVNNSDFTKQVQTTTIKEDSNLIYEKNETIIFDGNKAYHRIEEKQLSSDVNKEFDITITEFFYSKDKMYYFEDNVWKSEAFTVSKKLKTYDLKTDYFSKLQFNKKVEKEGVLQGDINDEHTSKVAGMTELTNMKLVIIVNEKFDVQKFNINATTASNRAVSISNVYTYQNEQVVLPVND